MSRYRDKQRGSAPPAEISAILFIIGVIKFADFHVKRTGYGFQLLQRRRYQAILNVVERGSADTCQSFQLPQGQTSFCPRLPCQYFHAHILRGLLFGLIVIVHENIILFLYLLFTWKHWLKNNFIRISTCFH